MKRTFSLLLVTALAVSACSLSPEQALENFCEAQDELGTALGGLNGLGLDSTVDEVEAVRDDISSAWDGYQEAAEDLGSVNTAQVDAAYQDYIDAVNDIPSDTSAGDAIDLALAAADVFWTEVDNIADSVTCE